MRPRRVSEIVNNFVNLLRTHSPRIVLTPEQESVATWLRGNEQVMGSLDRLLRRRIEDRASLPLSSNPDDAILTVARDRECREILATLHAICQSPVLTGSEEQDSVN